MKRKVGVLLAVLVVLNMAAAFAQTENLPIKVYDQEMPLSHEAYYKDKVILMVPLREVCEALGYTVTWDESSSTIVVTKGSFHTSLQTGVNAYDDNKVRPFPLAASPELHEGVTYVPSDFVTQVLKDSLYVQGEATVILSAPRVDFAYDFTENENVTFIMDNVAYDHSGYMLLQYMPVPINQNNAIYLAGQNDRDSMLLSMMIPLEDLQSQTIYDYNLEMVLAVNEVKDNQPVDTLIKSGISTSKPEQILEDSVYRMQGVMTGEPLENGIDLKVTSNVYKWTLEDNGLYAFKPAQLNDMFIADSGGKAYLVVGLETLSEENKSVYIDDIKLNCYQHAVDYDAIGKIQKFEGQEITLLSGDLMIDYPVVNENIGAFYLYQTVGMTEKEDGLYNMTDYVKESFTHYTTSGDRIYEASGEITEILNNTVTITTGQEAIILEYKEGQTIYPVGTEVIYQYYKTPQRVNELYALYNAASALDLVVGSVGRGSQGEMAIMAIDEEDQDYMILVGPSTSLNFDMSDLKAQDPIKVFIDSFESQDPPQGTALMIEKY